MYLVIGIDCAQSLGRLQVEAQDGLYDAVLHVGEFMRVYVLGDWD